MRLPAPIRHGAARVLGHIPVRVRAGANAGLRWSLASAGRGAVAGTFEQERITAIARLLCPGQCVWDIGAHKGYVSLLAARAVRAGGHVYAFEPSRINLELLRRHARWNRADNLDVMPVALSDVEGSDRFGGPGSSITYRLGQGEDTVTVRTVDALLRDGLRAPDLIKIDVEGNEGRVLAGARAALAGTPLLLVAIHSRSALAAVTDALAGTGYRLFLSPQLARNVHGADWAADPDLLALGPMSSLDTHQLGAFTAWQAPTAPCS